MRLQWKQEWTTPSVAGVISFGFGVALGVAAGYALNARKYKKLEAAIYKMKDSNEEMESSFVQAQFKMNEDKEKVNSMIQQVSHVIGKFKAEGQDFLEQYAREVKERLDDPTGLEFHEEATAELFTGKDDDWNYADEMRTRTSDTPYILNVDEYMADERDYRQSTLTYYRGDNILCDELDTPIYDIDKIVGKLEFGKGSRDPTIVYIRNEQLEAEYEVSLDFGYYQVEVLGQAIEEEYEAKDVKHSLHKFKKE
jgi:hypothetical protein